MEGVDDVRKLTGYFARTYTLFSEFFCIREQNVLCCIWRNSSRDSTQENATFWLELQMHCSENLKQILPEMKLRGLAPNFCIHVSVRDLYIPTIGPQTQYRKMRSREYINPSQIHEYRNWERDHAISFLGIFVSNFRYSGKFLTLNLFNLRDFVGLPRPNS